MRSSLSYGAWFSDVLKGNQCSVFRRSYHVVFVDSHGFSVASGGDSSSSSFWDNVQWFQGSSDLQNWRAWVVGLPGPWQQLDLVWKQTKASAQLCTRVLMKIGGHRAPFYRGSWALVVADAETNPFYLQADSILWRFKIKTERGGFYHVEHAHGLILVGYALSGLVIRSVILGQATMAARPSWASGLWAKLAANQVSAQDQKEKRKGFLFNNPFIKSKPIWI
jgi:hypothetical protein